jgi:hypothetical protein
MAASDQIALCCAGVLGLLGVIHMYWAFSGHRGNRIVIPQKGPDASSGPWFRPSRIGTIAVALALLAAAAVVFTAVSVTGNLLLAALFGLRAIGDFRRVGFCKSVRSTPFARWDTWLYSPLSLLLSIGCLASIGKS